MERLWQHLAPDSAATHVAFAPNSGYRAVEAAETCTAGLTRTTPDDLFAVLTRLQNASLVNTLLQFLGCWQGFMQDLQAVSCLAFGVGGWT